MQRLEEQYGPEGRQLFEGFVAQLKKIEQQNGLSARPPLLVVPSKVAWLASSR
jgi:hypothetical protein